MNNFDSVPRIRSVEPMKDIRRQIARQGESLEPRVPVASASTAPESGLQPSGA